MKALRQYFVLFVLVAVWGVLAGGTIAALANFSSSTVAMKARKGAPTAPTSSPVIVAEPKSGVGGSVAGSR